MIRSSILLVFVALLMTCAPLSTVEKVNITTLEEANFQQPPREYYPKTGCTP